MFNFTIEDTANFSATQVKKKLEDLEIKEIKNDENEINANEDIDLWTSDTQPCSCVYQHVREITERKMVLENPPCLCLLNSKRKIWDTCPCLTKCNYKKEIFFLIVNNKIFVLKYDDYYVKIFKNTIRRT